MMSKATIACVTLLVLLATIAMSLFGQGQVLAERGWQAKICRDVADFRLVKVLH